MSIEVNVFLTEEEILSIVTALGGDHPVSVKLVKDLEERKFQQRMDAYAEQWDGDVCRDIHLLAFKIGEHKAEGLADGGWTGEDSWYPIEDLMADLITDDTMFLYEHLVTIAGWYDMVTEVDGGGFYVYPKDFEDE